MNVSIDRIDSTVRATDSNLMLNDQYIDRLTRVLLKKVLDHLDHRDRVEDELKVPSSRTFEER